MLRSLIAFIWLITILISVTKAQEPLLEISQGVLQGSVFQNRDGGTLYGFRRIPYAQPPIDDLRFKVNKILTYLLLLKVIYYCLHY